MYIKKPLLWPGKRRQGKFPRSRARPDVHFPQRIRRRHPTLVHLLITITGLTPTQLSDNVTHCFLSVVSSPFPRHEIHGYIFILELHTTMAQQHVHFFRDSTYGFPPEAFEYSRLPDVDHTFINKQDLDAFERALQAPDPLHSPAEESTGAQSPKSPGGPCITKRDSQTGGGLENDVAAVAASAGAQSGDISAPALSNHGTFITAQSDWAPINPRLHKSKRGHKKKRKRVKASVEGLLGTRTKDETREGYLYQLSKWPLLVFVIAWLAGLATAYLSTRLYIWVYEHFFTWRGQRERLRRNMRQTSNYRDWVMAAKELDGYLGRQTWKEENDFAYYDSKTVRRVWDQMRKTRIKAEKLENEGDGDGATKATDELRALVEACVKNNFVGVENGRLYSQTYVGTKNLVQNFLDEGKHP